MSLDTTIGASSFTSVDGIQHPNTSIRLPEILPESGQELSDYALSRDQTTMPLDTTIDISSFTGVNGIPHQNISAKSDLANASTGSTATSDTNEGHKNNSSRPPDPPDLQQVVTQEFDRLHSLRKTMYRYRRRVMRARADARQQRRIADQALQRLLAKISPANLYTATHAGDNIILLAERARAAQRECRTMDEKVYKAETRLESMEIQVEERELEVYSRLHWLKAVHEVTDVSREQREEDGEGSEVSLRSDSTEIMADHIREYFEAVGHVNILRERLNNFEIVHRLALAQREEAFEIKAAKRKNEIDMLHMSPTHSEASFLRHELDSNEQFLDSYLEKRRLQANELLATRDLALRLRQRCMELGDDPDEEEGRDALNEALRYNLDGNIGRMYAIQHEGPHRGVMPLDLISVPFLHPRQRTLRWLTDMRFKIFGACHDELKYALGDPGPQKSFEMYFTEQNLADESKFGQWTSASDYKFSHMLGEERDPESTAEAQYTAYEWMPQWTCWAGEAHFSAPPASEPGMLRLPPASEPDMLRLPPASFNRWDKQKQKESLPEVPKPHIFDHEQAEIDTIDSLNEAQKEEQPPKRSEHDIIQDTLDYYGKTSNDHIRA